MPHRSTMRMTGFALSSLARSLLLLAAAGLVGCGSGEKTNVLPGAEAPPVTANERALKNPRMKADLESVTKKTVAEAR